MDTLAFSGLVDAVGGVVADVDVDVIATQPDGTEVIVVPAGQSRTLQGPQAAAYATYLAPGEPEEARMARFVQVLRLVVAKLPQEASKVEAIFTGLGASSRATVPTAQIAAFFVRLNADVLTDDVVYRNLPVKPIQDGSDTDLLHRRPRGDRRDGGRAVPRRRPQAGSELQGAGARAERRGLARAQRPGTPADPRRRVHVRQRRQRREPRSGHHDHRGARTPLTESLTWGNDIAVALKVPATAVQVATTGQSVADVIVVLGADFKPTT